MALSQTDLINKSLTAIGANAINDITEDTQNARVANRVYEGALRSILAECKWNFATKRALLSLSTDTLDWYDTGETVVYVRPTDVIRIFGVNSPSASWREEGDYIISDTTGLGLRYVFYQTSPSKYTAEFITAFMDLLSSDMAYAIVNSKSLGEAYKEKYESISLPKAQAANSQSGIQQTLQDDAWEMSKYTDNPVNA